MYYRSIYSIFYLPALKRNINYVFPFCTQIFELIIPELVLNLYCIPVSLHRVKSVKYELDVHFDHYHYDKNKLKQFFYLYGIMNLFKVLPLQLLASFVKSFRISWSCVQWRSLILFSNENFLLIFTFSVSKLCAHF